MSAKLHVFDFDKTLTSFDTIYGFYNEFNKKNLLIPRTIKRLILIIASILYKIRIINNDFLKSIGVWLFLKGVDIADLEDIANQYSKKIKLNKVYKNVFLNTPKKIRVISSASFHIYLKYIFPGENIIGTKLKYYNGRVVSVISNNYGNKKANHFTSIDYLYTDSFSDKPLMDLSNNVFLVSGDKLKKIK